MSIIRGTQKSDFDYSAPLHKIQQEEYEKAKQENRSLETANKHVDERIVALKKEHEQERELGTAYHGSMKWGGIETREDWQKLYALSKEQYASGKFFFNWIGRGKELEPELVITLVVLRDQWIREYEINTIPEHLLLDCALVSYYHLLRTNYIIGNIESDIEWNLFASDSPSAKLRRAVAKNYDSSLVFEGYTAEDSLRAISNAQLPLLDTLNRMFIRNLKAIRDLKRGNIQLNIGSVGQMNIGDKQINVEKSVDKNQ